LGAAMDSSASFFLLIPRSTATTGHGLRRQVGMGDDDVQASPE
jgi:hypothetical protein